MEWMTRDITLGGQRISYVQDGPRDRSVLLIHGNSSSKAAFRDQCAQLVQSGYGVLAFDLPGHGASADALNPAEDYTISAYAKTAAALCEATGVTRPLLCGWSLGGHVAIQMAGETPDYAGLMIFGTPPIGLNLEDAANAFLPGEFNHVTGLETPSEAELSGYLSAVYGAAAAIPDELLQTGVRTDGRSRAFMVQHWQSGQDLHDQRAIVETWPGPLLILHGVKDPFVSADYFSSLDLTSKAGTHPFKLLETVGHAPFLETPSAFNRMLLDFCETCFDA
ncbi:MAG: alpha/beta hydrolase [Pseudomonadota bacterium]